jgi:thiamine-phosphate pyrophosphorylase
MADKLARAKLARAARRFAVQSGSALPPLILMTDDERLADPLAAARALPRGSMVILRTRKRAEREWLARALRAIARARGLRLLVAGDPDLAARIGADGIHLPEIERQHAAHWRARRANWIITTSAHSLSAVTSARHADAVIVAPVFGTASHPGAATLGALRLRLLAQHSALPVYALGGIDARTVQKLSNARLAGIAAIGALAT